MRRIYKRRGLNYQAVILLMLIFTCCSGKSEKVVPMNSLEESTVSQTKLDEKGIEVIDLGANFKMSKDPFPMSEIVDVSDVQYIKLETTDDALLSLVGRMKVIGDRIFLSDVDNFEYVYQFDMRGKFINRVGKIGQGPGEYKKASGFTVDKNTVYLPIMSRDYVYVYDRQGSYKRKIDGTVFTRSIGSQDNFLVLVRSTVCNNQDIFSFIIFDKNGKLIYRHKPEVDKDLVNKDRWLLSYQSPPITQTNDRILLFEAVDNYLYSIKGQHHKPEYKVNMGKYQMPLEYILGNIRSKKEVFSYFSLFGIFETSEDILFRFTHGEDFQESYIACFNKQSKKIEFWRLPDYQGEKESDVLYNDIDGGPSYVIRNNMDDPNYLYVVIYPHMAEKYLEKWRDKTVKYPEKRAQLCKLLSEMEEDDNPILVLYKKK